MSSLDRKRALQAELVARLASQLDAARNAHQSAIEGATHEQARAENDKDTRGLEQSYLARGHSARIADLEVAVAAVRALALRPFTEDQPVALGALVAVDDDGRRLTYFIASHGGGETLADGTVQVVTPRSPLGVALVGKQPGDVVELRLAGRRRELEILDIE
jgi:transcription elongation GreA/GreB family factor